MIRLTCFDIQAFPFDVDLSVPAHGSDYVTIAHIKVSLAKPTVVDDNSKRAHYTNQFSLITTTQVISKISETRAYALIAAPDEDGYMSLWPLLIHIMRGAPPEDRYNRDPIVWRNFHVYRFLRALHNNKLGSSHW